MSVPPPPSSEPESRPAPAAPAASAGLIIETLKDWYAAVRDYKVVIHGDEYERVLGFTGKVGLNVRTEIVYGWSHTTIIGAALTQVIGFENKFNGGAQINFINVVKSETTKGNKDEKVSFGIKAQHVKGATNKFEGASATNSNVLKLAKHTKEVNEVWSLVEKRLAATVKQEIQDLLDDHQKMEEELRQLEYEVKTENYFADGFIAKANKLIEDYRTAKEQCDSVDTKVSGKFRIVSDAAADFNASTEVDVTCSGNRSVTAGSLISFGAALTKLG
jgi:uncharacterized protein YoxC